jgi:hypothetical protein
MIRMRDIALCIAAVILSGWPGVARAQGVPVVPQGTRVWVTTGDGREQEGTLASISSSELILVVGAATQSIPFASVRRLEARDSLVNGMRNGAIVGGAALGGFGVFVSHALCEIPDGCFPQDLAPILLLAGMGAGAGIAAGALVDHVIEGRRVLYSSPGPPVVIRFGPSLFPPAVGMHISVAWGR